MPPRVFDGQPSLAHATKPMDRLTISGRESLLELDKRGDATFKEWPQGVVRKIGDPPCCLGAARWKRQFQHLACEFLSACKRVIDVAACLDSLAVGHLQALFFVGLHESLVGLAVLCRQKQVNGFSKFPCDIVLDLGVRVAWLADWPLGRL